MIDNGLIFDEKAEEKPHVIPVDRKWGATIYSRHES